MGRKLILMLCAAAVGCAIARTARAEGSPEAGDSVAIRDVGSFYVGGRVATVEGLPRTDITLVPGAPPLTIDPNGQFEVEQMYAQYIRLAEPKAKYPLLLWHGGGLTGATWESTPDGRSGWQMFFLRAGHDVYISDAVERGRSGWARFPQIFTSEPIFRTMREGWGLFRIGPADGWDPDPAKRRPFPDTQFPVAAYDQFTKESVPRWTTTDKPVMAAYDALVQKVCPCVVIVHSQGGYFGFNAALNAPDKIKALIAVEPSSTPEAGADASRIRGVPHLVVWGDHQQGIPFWTNARNKVTAWQGRIRETGGVADTLDLPAQGIRGNSHMLMMDANSDAIAERVQRWMGEQGLMR
ncbi:esterase [Methylobacterium sp. J-030]|uniref:esterase n=1 Tax=Methylobacterium sp. J-030 TaxID=2836627 RepID=UPI001FB92E72|nr:esterase [Methylobacterium sp. J-030]MCJ2072433.1 esterase [Methylobacterium sp. J-030]